VTLAPLEVVTVTSTVVPAVPAGEVTVTVVEVLDKTVATVAPKSTAVGLARLVPSTVTCWPPAVGPEFAITPETRGPEPNTKRSLGATVEVTPAIVSVTSTVPATSAGEVAVQLVVEEHETAVAAVTPNIAEAAPTVKPEPVMTTTVPPPIGPVLGAIPEIPRGRVKVWVVAAEGPPLFETVWPVKTWVVEVPAVSVTVRVAVNGPAVT
jgi:hypothetical protein